MPDTALNQKELKQLARKVIPGGLTIQESPLDTLKNLSETIHKEIANPSGFRSEEWVAAATPLLPYIEAEIIKREEKITNLSPTNSTYVLNAPPSSPKTHNR